MQLGELLRAEHVLVPLRATTVREGVARMLQRMVETGAIRDPDVIDRLQPEGANRDIVAIGDIAVLPHYRTEAVDRLVVALAVSASPLGGLGAREAAAPRIIVLVLAPPGAAVLYLQTIATVARMLRQEATVSKILTAGSAEEILALPQIGELKIQPRLTVRDIMTHNVESVGADASVRDVVDLMARRRTRAVPIVGDKGEVLGIITERDVMRALLPQIPRAGGETPSPESPDTRVQRVRDIMTRSVLCVSEDVGLDEVANMMINKDVEQLPVVSEGKLTGIVTRADMVRKLFGR